MTYYLLDKPNPNGSNFYASRKGPVLAIVMHVTAGLQGLPSGADKSAENTARYAATTDRKVSWHSGSDCDSHLQLLPDSYVAFQCQGYNTHTVGHEISKKDVVWSDESPEWVEKTLRMAADSLRDRARALGVPLRRATRAELDSAIAKGGKPVGFVDHSLLDPSRRQDPGKDFPWDRFFALMRGDTASATTVQEDDDMPVISKDPSSSKQYVHDYLTKRHIKSASELGRLAKKLKRDDSLTVEDLTAMPEVKA